MLSNYRVKLQKKNIKNSTQNNINNIFEKYIQIMQVGKLTKVKCFQILEINEYRINGIFIVYYKIYFKRKVIKKSLFLLCL